MTNNPPPLIRDLKSQADEFEKFLNEAAKRSTTTEPTYRRAVLSIHDDEELYTRFVFAVNTLLCTIKKLSDEEQ